LPALLRYTGPSFRLLRAYLRDQPTPAVPLDLLILSARFGLITADQPILPYDQRMTPARAVALQPVVSSALQRFVSAHGPYSATLIHLGPDYWPALSPL